MGYAEGGKRLRGATSWGGQDLGSGVDKALGAALAVEMVCLLSGHDDSRVWTMMTPSR